MNAAPEVAWHSARDYGAPGRIVCGGQWYAAVVASIAVAQEVEQGNVVTILPDDGSKYVSLGIFA